MYIGPPFNDLSSLLFETPLWLKFSIMTIIKPFNVSEKVYFTLDLKLLCRK